jgi:hypothetical protein
LFGNFEVPVDLSGGTEGNIHFKYKTVNFLEKGVALVGLCLLWLGFVVRTLRSDAHELTGLDNVGG